VYDRRELVQVDLADVANLKQFNDGVQFLLLVIDSFSRMAWIRPLANKSGVVVSAAMRSVIEQMGKSPKRLLTDSGVEFLNKNFKALLNRYGIVHSTSTSEVKAPHVERFCGSMKRLISNYMTERETRRYIDQLDNLLLTYNTRGHRSLQYMSPQEADHPSNRDKVLDILNRKYETVARHRSEAAPKFKVGNVVRLKIAGSPFRKGHDETYTSEMFKIKEVLTNLPITRYVVSSFDGKEVVEGTWYSSELSLCTGAIFKVEKVLKKKRLPNGKLRYFVKWLHFGPEYNSWIDQGNVEEVYDG
jgi:hypothetical protein